MKKFIQAFAMAVAAAVLLTAPIQAEEIILAHGANPGNPRYDAANMFAVLVSTYCPDLNLKVALMLASTFPVEGLRSMFDKILGEFKATVNGFYTGGLDMNY